MRRLAVAALLLVACQATPRAAPPTASPAPVPTPSGSATPIASPAVTGTATPSPMPTGRAFTPTAPPSTAPRRWPARPFSIAEADVQLPAPYIANGTVVGGGSFPSRSVSVSYFGPDCGSAGAALSPDGRRLLYLSVATVGAIASPSLRLLDRLTGEDGIFAEGACAPAWAPDGRVAYLQGQGPVPTGDSYPTKIVVRASLFAAPVTWTADAGTYIGVHWAGNRLFASRRVPLSGSAWAWELVLFLGPSATRSFGYESELVAVSPDGSRALVTTLPLVPLETTERATLRLIRLADGADLASLRLDPEAENLAPDGAWRGDRVLASVGLFPGGAMHPSPGLFVISVAGDHLAVTAQFWFSSPFVGVGPFASYGKPFFVDADRVGALFALGRVRYIECDLADRSCLLGPELREFAQLLR